jgi:hypothetical protein
MHRCTGGCTSALIGCTGTDNLGGILNFFVSQIYLTSFGVLFNHDLDKSNPRDREATIPLTR